MGLGAFVGVVVALLEAALPAFVMTSPPPFCFREGDDMGRRGPSGVGAAAAAADIVLMAGSDAK